MSIIALDLGFYWKTQTNNTTAGFFTSTNTTTPLPTNTEPYEISNSNALSKQFDSSIYLNSVAQTLSDNRLATTLSINIGESNTYEDNNTVIVNYSAIFKVILYPFLNGSNITIVGGAISTGQDWVETTTENGTIINVQTESTYYTGYTLTVLNQSFPASDSNCTLYFRLDQPGETETYSLVQ
jgi:hypothetical protein